MRRYAKVSPRVWTGRLGQLMHGRPRMQALVYYLTTCPHSNLVGIYRAPVAYLEADLGADKGSIEPLLDELEDFGFLERDRTLDLVWIVDHLRHELGDRTSKSQRRGIAKVLDDYAGSFLVRRFAEKYPEYIPSGYPIDTPPHRVSAQEQEQEQEKEQGQDDAPSATRVPIPEPLTIAIPDFPERWAERMKAAPRGKPTKSAEAKQLDALAETLARHGTAPVLAAIEEATLGGYQGIFPDKHIGKNNDKRKSSTIEAKTNDARKEKLRNVGTRVSTGA